MIWIQGYAFVWMLLGIYRAFLTADRGQRLRRVDMLVENAHTYEIMLMGLSPRIFVGVLTAVELMVIAFDTYGFLLALSYLSPLNWQKLVFFVVVLCFIIDALVNLTTVKKLSRILTKPAPFLLLARYMRRYFTESSVTACVSSYGRCFIAVKLFLALQNA